MDNFSTKAQGSWEDYVKLCRFVNPKGSKHTTNATPDNFRWNMENILYFKGCIFILGEKYNQCMKFVISQVLLLRISAI